jgi:hypothetical protein
LLIEARRAMTDNNNNMSATARALKIPRGTLKNRLRVAASRGIAARMPSDELDVPKPPDSSEPISELIARKAAQFNRDEDSRAFHKLVKIGVRTEGPIVIAAVGDPHVDDDRCDVHRLIADMEVIGKTEGMYPLHVGDITNNWVGRLGRLYAHQSTKASDGIRLAEYMFQLAPPLAVVAGNHDLWNEGMSWLTFCLRQSSVDAKLVQAHGVRIELGFPGGKSLRIHARHDFPGHSQFNPNHGLAKEHLFGQRDHINIAGHRHIDAVTGTPSPEGYVHWGFRVSGYKAMDDYAISINAKEMKMAPTVGLLIDVNARHKAETVKPFWDLEAAADYLKFIRKRGVP